MGDLLQPWHLVVLGVVAFLLFGAKRLPELGKGLGEGGTRKNRLHARGLLLTPAQDTLHTC